MLLNAPEEPPLTTLLRKTITRLRDLTPHAEEETSAAKRGEEANRAGSFGVPLVLPFDAERRLIPRLIRKLRRGRFLRYSPDTLAEYAPLTPHSTEYFLKSLRTTNIRRWRECVVSIWALGRLTPEDPARVEAEKIICWLISPQGGNISVPTNRRLIHLWLRDWFYLSYFVVWQFFYLNRSTDPLSVFLELLITVLLGLISTVPVTAFLLFCDIPRNIVRMNRIRARALLTLGRWREPRHLSLLLREYVEKKGRVRLAAEIALREVMPLLERGDTGECAADFVPNLCRALRRKERQILDYTPREEALEILLLEALGKVGDGQALPTVQRIAGRGRTPRLQELAQSILPILQARSQHATDPNQLLRGTVRPDSPSTMLLRPAHAACTPCDQLLRPHTPENRV